MSSPEEELRKLREKFEVERDKKIQDAIQEAYKARMEIGELKAMYASLATHIHDVERKAEAALRFKDEVESTELPGIKQQLGKLQPAGKFYSSIESSWMKLLVGLIITASLASLGMQVVK